MQSNGISPGYSGWACNRASKPDLVFARGGCLCQCPHCVDCRFRTAVRFFDGFSCILCVFVCLLGVSICQLSEEGMCVRRWRGITSMSSLLCDRMCTYFCVCVCSDATADVVSAMRLSVDGVFRSGRMRDGICVRSECCV